MSRVTVQPIDPLSKRQSEPLGNFAQASRQVLSSAIGASKPLFEAYADVLKAGLPLVRQMHTGPCDIPERECPPYCVCQIYWEATPGEHLHATIRVTNTGKQARPFEFQASPFQGPSGNTGATPTLALATATLKPNESVVLNLDVVVDKPLEANGSYTADVKIRGLYEQCVRLNLSVQPASIPHCEVRQGEMPMHIHAHRWYHHFQCEEPCFEPVRPRRREETAAASKETTAAQ